jgi:hypothetical protein
MANNIISLTKIEDRLKHYGRGFRKSSIKYPYFDYVFITKDTYLKFEHEYENFVDKYGIEHIVQIKRNSVEKEFKDEDFYYDEGFNYIRHNEVSHIDTCIFNYNLKKYIIIGCSSSPYQLIQYILHDRNVNYSDYRCYVYNNCDYFPIYEDCFMSGNNYSIISNYIPDGVFFSFKDKQKAYDMVSRRTQIKLDEVGYLKMTDDELIKYLFKRSKDKLEFIKLYKKNNK